MEIYTNLAEITHGIIAEAFSESVVVPGITTTSDLEWWMRDKVTELGLKTWFHPTVDIQRTKDQGGDHLYSFSDRPENNIIVSLNGVVQEPGVGFEIVGSRIIFSEIPRVDSTFVAFSYVGSEADVDAAEVVPPIEPGDFIDIQGETADREVAVIESSNSLITFDYLGSVFGQNADATAVLTSGYIEKVQVTSGGSGYTSRPVVRLDSISGFDGQVKALVGVAGVTVTSGGSNYENPSVDAETSVPDDWTAPDLSLYGEEVIDPEVNP